MARQSTPAIGEVKFAILHHGGCPRTDCHYQISFDGVVSVKRSEHQRGQHPNSIGVRLDSNCDQSGPTAEQIHVLKNLLVELVLRYPNIKLGGHRQIRGDNPTTCPGRKFPLKDLREWFTHELPALRDSAIADDIAAQYGP